MCRLKLLGETLDLHFEGVLQRTQEKNES
jgi:hypothetical protein